MENTKKPIVREIIERPITFKILENMKEEEVDSELEFLNDYLVKVKDKKEQYNKIRLEKRKKKHKKKLIF